MCQQLPVRDALDPAHARRKHCVCRAVACAHLQHALGVLQPCNVIPKDARRAVHDVVCQVARQLLVLPSPVFPGLLDLCALLAASWRWPLFPLVHSCWCGFPIFWWRVPRALRWSGSRRGRWRWHAACRWLWRRAPNIWVLFRGCAGALLRLRNDIALGLHCYWSRAHHRGGASKLTQVAQALGVLRDGLQLSFDGAAQPLKLCALVYAVALLLQPAAHPRRREQLPCISDNKKWRCTVMHGVCTALPCKRNKDHIYRKE